LLSVKGTVEQAAEMFPGAIEMVEADGSSTVFAVGSTSMERMVRYLAGLPWACSALEPRGLRRALQSHAEKLAAANR
jgi:hypothetical protein